MTITYNGQKMDTTAATVAALIAEDNAPEAGTAVAEWPLPSAVGQNAGRRHRRRGGLVLPAVIVVVGLLVMLYPVVSTRTTQNNAPRASAARPGLQRKRMKGTEV